MSLPLCLAGVGDGQDGPATAEAWLKELPWNGTKAFMASQRHLWRPDLTSLHGVQQVQAFLRYTGPGFRVQMLGLRAEDLEFQSASCRGKSGGGRAAGASGPGLDPRSLGLRPVAAGLQTCPGMARLWCSCVPELPSLLYVKTWSSILSATMQEQMEAPAQQLAFKVRPSS